MSIDIEKELERVHKLNADAGFQIVAMLATRRLNIKRIEHATDLSRKASDAMDVLLKQLKDQIDEKAKEVVQETEDQSAPQAEGKAAGRVAQKAKPARKGPTA